MENNSRNEKFGRREERRHDNRRSRSYESASQKYNIEVAGLPMHYSFSDLKRLLFETLRLKPYKVQRGMGKSVAFITFKDEAARAHAFFILDGYRWLGHTLKAENAGRSKDPSLLADIEYLKLPKKEHEKLPLKARITKAVVPYHNQRYKEQLIEKEKTVLRLMRTFANMLFKMNSGLKKFIDWQKARRRGQACEVDEIIPSPDEKGYCNKCEFTIGMNKNSRRPVIGFQVASHKGASVQVGPIHHLQNINGKMKNVVKLMEKFLESTKYKPYDPFSYKGVWRQLIVRTSNTKDVMVIVVINLEELDKDEIEKLKTDLVTFFTEGKGKEAGITSMFFQRNKNKHGGKDSEFEHLFGKTYMEETVLGKTFRASPEASFQVNSPVWEVLYKKIAELAEIDHASVMLDICCGVGTIGLSCAESAYRIMGVDTNREAIKNARSNAEINGLTNAVYHYGNAEDYITTMVEMAQNGNTVAIVNLPKSGLRSNVANALRTCDHVKKVIYISSNPEPMLLKLQSLCRPPGKTFKGSFFVPIRVIPVDLFPGTPQFMLVTLFEKYDQQKWSRIIEGNPRPEDQAFYDRIPEPVEDLVFKEREERRVRLKKIKKNDKRFKSRQRAWLRAGLDGKVNEKESKGDKRELEKGGRIVYFVDDEEEQEEKSYSERDEGGRDSVECLGDGRRNYSEREERIGYGDNGEERSWERRNNHIDFRRGVPNFFEGEESDRRKCNEGNREDESDSRYRKRFWIPSDHSGSSSLNPDQQHFNRSELVFNPDEQNFNPGKQHFIPNGGNICYNELTSNSDGATFNRNGQPFNNTGHTFNPDGQPYSSDRQPFSPGRQLISHSGQSFSYGGKPLSPGRQLEIPDGRPLIPDRRPVIFDRRRVTPDRRRVTPDRRRVTPDRRRVTPERRRVTPERRRVTAERRRVTPERRRIIPERRRITPERRPVIPDRGPLTPDRRPLTFDRRPLIHDRRPLIPDRRPLTPDRLPVTPDRPYSSVPDRRPSVPDRRPSVPDRRPSIPNRRPSIPDRRPSIPDGRPSIPDGRPSIPDGRPSIPDGRPSIPDGRPSIPDGRPSIPDGRPSIPDGRPSIPDGRPSITDRRHLIPYRQPSIPDRQPSISDRHQVIPDRHPLIPDRQPLIPDRQPFIPDRQPLMSDRQPLMSDRQPLIPDGQLFNQGRIDTSLRDREMPQHCRQSFREGFEMTLETLSNEGGDWNNIQNVDETGGSAMRLNMDVPLLQGKETRNQNCDGYDWNSKFVTPTFSSETYSFSYNTSAEVGGPNHSYGYNQNRNIGLSNSNLPDKNWNEDDRTGSRWNRQNKRDFEEPAAKKWKRDRR